MVFKRSSSLACATVKFDITLLYQQYMVGRVLVGKSDIYLNPIRSCHRLGGAPGFGNGVALLGRFALREQTPESSVHFERGMLQIAADLKQPLGLSTRAQTLKGIGSYTNPILCNRAGRSMGEFLGHLENIYAGHPRGQEGNKETD